MPFFIYGSDARTGIVAKRIYSEAETDAEARAHGEVHGLVVTAVVPCSADQNPDIVAARARASSVLRDPATLAADERKQAFSAFSQTLKSETPTTYITYLLIAINVLVFVAMVISGVSAISPQATDLLLWGSEFGMYTVNGEWWRVFTEMFVHVGVLHLISNMFAFVYVAPYVERMFGNVGFLMLYVVSGLGGGMLALYLGPMQIHAGASAAVFGVYGALLAVLLRERDSIPPEVSDNLQKFVLVFIAYNLINSLRPGISMAAHVGGLIIGFVCGWIAAQPLKIESQAGRRVRNLMIACVGVVVCVIGVFSINAKYPNLDHMQDSLTQYDAMEKESYERFQSASQQNEKGRITNQAFADRIDADVLPDWRTARKALDEMPEVGSKALDLMRQAAPLRQVGLETLSAALRSNDQDKLSDARRKLKEADFLSSWEQQSRRRKRSDRPSAYRKPAPASTVGK